MRGGVMIVTLRLRFEQAGALVARLAPVVRAALRSGAQLTMHVTHEEEPVSEQDEREPTEAEAEATQDHPEAGDPPEDASPADVPGAGDPLDVASEPDAGHGEPGGEELEAGEPDEQGDAHEVAEHDADDEDEDQVPDE